MATIGTMDIICPNPECKHVIGVKPINQRSGGKTTICCNCHKRIKVKYTKDSYKAEIIG